MATRCFNCSAGPGVLPEEVLKQVQQDVWDVAGSGVGILEHSHRGKVVDKIFEEAEADCRKIGNIPPEYRILFLTGGASAQNHMIPMNFMRAGRTADYIVTGAWSVKTWEQADKMQKWFDGKGGGVYGQAHLACSTKGENYTYAPGEGQIKYSDRPAYIHYCSNETIQGVEFKRDLRDMAAPAGVPIICDASSHIYSKPFDFTKYAMVYAGAQKNLGPAGVTLAIIHNDFMESGGKDVPELLQYRAYAPELSRPNTPPVFAVYVMGLVFKWIIRQGGLTAMQKHNEAKAKIIYDAIDGSGGYYKGHARADSRSLMNITFRLPSEALEDKFIKDAKGAGLDSLKGHRSVGGIRASVYNAFPKAGCEARAGFMEEFAKNNG
jgi:phosphoserine aminotransferase